MLSSEELERRRVVKNEKNRRRYHENLEANRALKRQAAKLRREKSAEELREYRKVYDEINRDRILESRRRRRAEVRAGLRPPEKKYLQSPEKKKAYYAANSDKYRERYIKWSRANPGAERMRANSRRQAVKQATPTWANFDAMEKIYEKAKELEKETGEKYDVDHIYPLQGENVCGLHCEANLQILTRADNRRKRNQCPSVYSTS